MAANGVGVPTKIQLSGTGITQLAGPVYQVTLSLSGTSTVAVTAAAKDIAGSDPSYAGIFTWLSYNAGTGSGDVARIATVDGSGNVTAVHKGQAIISASCPSFDVDGTNALISGKVYALLQVTVTA